MSYLVIPKTYKANRKPNREIEKSIKQDNKLNRNIYLVEIFELVYFLKIISLVMLKKLV